MRKLLNVVAISALAPVAAAGIAVADQADWPESFTIATASQGGTYFQYGSGWANLMGEEVGVGGSAEVTGGPVQNMALVHAGEVEFALTTAGPAAEALAGQSPTAPGVVMDRVRAIYPMYETPFTFVVERGAGIESFEDLPAGVRIGVGPAGGTADAYWPRMLELMGVEVDARNAGWADLANQFKDGLIDAIAFGAGVPVPAASELEATMEIDFLDFTPEQVAALEENFPVVAHTVPSSTYETLRRDDRELSTVSMWNFAIADVDLPEDFVYEVVKATMENNDKMVTIHRSAETTIPENVQFNNTIPWHAGAVRYFEEIGIEIPDELKG